MNNINNTTAMNTNNTKNTTANTSMDMATRLVLASLWLDDNFVTKESKKGSTRMESKSFYWDKGAIYRFIVLLTPCGGCLLKHYYTANGNATEVMEVVLTTTETKASALIVEGDVMDATKYQPKTCRVARH